MFDLIDPNLQSHRSAAVVLTRMRSFLARHLLEEAMLLCVMGWSLMWADALSLVALPMWIPVAGFYAGLILIPFSQGRETL